MAGMKDYDRYDAMGLAELVRQRKVSPAELLDEALTRAERVNPKLNALVHLVPERARAAIAAGLPAGPFTGVPFLLKDLGAEAIGYPTNSGSRFFANYDWTYDSEIFIRLRATGLVTFGRTTSPELGVGPVTEAAVYGGPTRNPWNLNHTSGGSSGGAAAAVAAGVTPIAHGSDGGGSVRIHRSLGGQLIAMGALTREETTLASIRVWIAAHPEETARLLNTNPSYIFFSQRPATADGPIGSLGVPLTPERSAAVDATQIPLGVPLWIDTLLPDGSALQRLVLAQDTGGAIRGAARADLFVGQGAEAGKLAGEMKQKGRFYVLLPKTITPVTEISAR